jgi:hypothetical protein
MLAKDMVGLAQRAKAEAREQARQAWEAQHNTYLGGSDAYQLLNQAQYGKGCWRALGYEKLGVEPDFAVEPDDALFKRGEILEPIAARIYEDTTGRKVRRPAMDEYFLPRPKHHPHYKWAAVSTDRLILAQHGGVSYPGDLELKTRAEGPYRRIMREGPFPGDELQLQWSMFVTGHSWGSLGILGVFGAMPFTYIDRKLDPEVLDIFVRQGEKFADAVWGKGELPDPVFGADDQRCKVCAWRMICRGKQIDQDELRELEQLKASSRPLVQIDQPALAQKLSYLDMLKSEQKALKEEIKVATDEAKQLLIEEAVMLRGYGKVYRLQIAAQTYTVNREAYEVLKTYPNKEEQA